MGEESEAAGRVAVSQRVAPIRAKRRPPPPGLTMPSTHTLSLVCVSFHPHPSD